jgi:hypothetical protein
LRGRQAMHARRRWTNDRRLKDITRMSGGLLLFNWIREESKMKKPKTHFEQVPIVVVQKLAVPEIEGAEPEAKIQEDPCKSLGKAMQ